MVEIKDLGAYKEIPDAGDFVPLQEPDGTPARTTFAGVPRVIALPFAYNTANILTGAALFTPTIGDVLLDAWIEITTAWNGTTPKGDVGAFIAGDIVGWLGSVVGPAPMDVVDVSDGSKLPHGLLTQGTATTPSGLLSQLIYTGYQSRRLPAKFTTADPVKVCVSQDGYNDGADPGSSQGAAVLYLVVCTPASA